MQCALCRLRSNLLVKRTSNQCDKVVTRSASTDGPATLSQSTRGSPGCQSSLLGSPHSPANRLTNCNIDIEDIAVSGFSFMISYLTLCAV